MSSVSDNILNTKEIISHLTNHNWHAITEELQYCPNLLMKSENISLIDLHLLVEVLHTAAAEIETNHPAVCPVVKECFRSLRNSCVDASEVQTGIAEKTTALDDTKTILQSLSRLQDNIYTIVVQVGVQFLGNLIVNNLNNQTIVWKKLSDVLMDLLNYNDSKVTNCTSMVIYNILLGCPDISTGDKKHTVHLLEALIQHAMKDSEFALFTIQLLLAKEGYLKSVYHKLKLEHNLFILEAIHAMIALDPDEVWKSSDVPTSSIEFLIYEFKRHPMCLFQPCRKSEEEMEPKVAAKLLEIIASASGDNRYLKDLQKDSNLLVDCIYLLKFFHELSESGNNSFSSIDKLSKLYAAQKSGIVQAHPSFGFKVSLVRLIGNLCWKHRANQKVFANLEGIPLLLNCCKIDARNPLITQWAIFSVRNLCEGNPESQALIAGLTQRGTVDSATLRELGITLHQEDDKKIVIMPYKP